MTEYVENQLLAMSAHLIKVQSSAIHVSTMVTKILYFSVCVRAGVSTCGRSWVFACVRACVRVCRCVRMCVYLRTCFRGCACVCACIHECVRAFVGVSVRAGVSTCVRACVCVRLSRRSVRPHAAEKGGEYHSALYTRGLFMDHCTLCA